MYALLIFGVVIHTIALLTPLVLLLAMATGSLTVVAVFTVLSVGYFVWSGGPQGIVMDSTPGGMRLEFGILALLSIFPSVILNIEEILSWL